MSLAGAPGRSPVFPRHGAGGWRARLLALRDRLLGSPRFQTLASAFPLTRPIARRHTRALFDLCAGFVYSQVLLACVRLQLFERLADGPREAGALAAELGLSQEAMSRLLRAAASLNLLESRGGAHYGLGMLGAALRANPGVLAMIEHHSLLYEDLRDPVALLRGERETALQRYWAYADDRRERAPGERDVADYTALMAATQPMIAQEVLHACRLDRHRCLLDVGGGDGSFLRAVAERVPTLSLMLLDLPPVAEQARVRFAEAGLSSRARALGGDAFNEPLPRGADVISLVRVVHDHDETAVRRLLAAVYAALPPGGALVLAEPMAEVPGAEPIGDAYFGFYLHAMGQGQARTVGHLQALLREAGFERPVLRPTRTPLLTCVIQAWKPGRLTE